MQLEPLTETRVGGWIQTYTGVAFYPFDPRPSEIHIYDIAHALSMQCRFTGHVKEFYSVAQHSVLVALHCPREDRLWALLHDATEAYLVDVARPVKQHAVMEPYRTIENDLERMICQRFGLPLEKPSSVHIADKRMLATEKRDLMGTEPMDWEWPYDAFPYKIRAWTPKEAEEIFLTMYAGLTKNSPCKTTEIIGTV
jgi:hypothetical protein